MRLRLLSVAAILAVIGVLSPPASAHPLGNFSINHLTQVRISADRIQAHYVLDQAEIPTFQERGLPPEEVLKRKQAEVVRALKLEVNGRTVPLRLEPGGRISYPPGQGGLTLTRVARP